MRKAFSLGSLLLLGGLLLGFSGAAAEDPPSTATRSDGSRSACPSPEARQFDFWIGDWNVVNRRLPAEGDWADAGTATDRVYSLLDGCAIIEHWRGNLGARPIKGFSIRAYNPDTKKWHLLLNWPGKDRPGFGILTGEFRHGRGEFFSKGKDAQGNDRLTRYSFSDASHSSLRWDAAYSTDGGRTWFSNWIMEFSRRNLETDLPLFDGPTQSKSWCSFPEAREMDGMAGAWTGPVQIEGPEESDPEAQAVMESYVILDGCAVMDFVTVTTENYEPYKIFFIRAYVPQRKRWVLYSIDNRKPVFKRFEGELKDGVIEMTQAGAGGGEVPSERYVWSFVDSDSLRMEHLKSADEGKNWTSQGVVFLKRKP